jgi:hypothetical protein
MWFFGSVGVTGKGFCYAAPSNYILSAKASKRIACTLTTL